MTSINTALSSYYQLANQSGSSSTSSTATTLADALQAIDGSDDTSSSSSDAYTLNLSAQAQQLLSGSTTSSSTASSTGSSNFVLTSAQENTITTILEKYKDSPFDQATFDQIQNDLTAAGLGSTQLSAQDQVTSFNPTSNFLSALNGDYSNLSDPSTSASTEQTKTTNYMNNIISFWKSISTTASASDTASAASTASS